jgi:hypothetical protein
VGRNAVVVVPGRASKTSDSARNEEAWRKALLRGLAAVGATTVPPEDLFFAHYGSVFAEHRRGDAGNDAARRRQRRFEQQVGEMIEARLVARGVAVAAYPFGMLPWYDRWAALLDQVPGLSAAFLRVAFRDVYNYLTDAEGLRQRSIDLVCAPIAASQERERVVVLAHSLGSIVAYDVLNTNPHLRVDLFVTLGSPLGIDRGVRRRLLADQHRRRDVPAGVRRWVNVADENDFVALDETLGDDFGKRRRNILTDIRVRNPRRSPHSGTAYVGQKAVCSEIAKALRV